MTDLMINAMKAQHDMDLADKEFDLNQSSQYLREGTLDIPRYLASGGKDIKRESLGTWSRGVFGNELSDALLSLIPQIGVKI